MRTALASFFPYTQDRLSFIANLGVKDTILWATTFRDASELSFTNIVSIKSMVEDAGLNLFGFETLATSFIDKIVLGAPGRDEQIDVYLRFIEALGRAGIRHLSYNWMISGVWRTTYTQPIEGGARGTGFDFEIARHAPLVADREYWEDEFWENYEYFITKALPVAEEFGVVMSIHPNDPPVEKLGGLPCLMRSRANIDRALAIRPSDNHALTFCLGNWGAMGEDLPAAIRHYGPKVDYVHFQAVRGTVPKFHEVFAPEADYEPIEIIRALDDIGFEGVIIPGHVPQVTGDPEWRTELSAKATPFKHPMGGHAGRALTVGYVQGLIDAVRGRQARRQGGAAAR